MYRFYRPCRTNTFNMRVASKTRKKLATFSSHQPISLSSSFDPTKWNSFFIRKCWLGMQNNLRGLIPPNWSIPIRFCIVCNSVKRSTKINSSEASESLTRSSSRVERATILHTWYMFFGIPRGAHSINFAQSNKCISVPKWDMIQQKFPIRKSNTQHLMVFK